MEDDKSRVINVFEEPFASLEISFLLRLFYCLGIQEGLNIPVQQPNLALQIRYVQGFTA